MHDKNQDTESRWTRVRGAIPTRSQALTIFFAVLMVASMPAPFAFAGAMTSGTAEASTTTTSPSLDTASLSTTTTTTTTDNASYYEEFDNGTAEDWEWWNDTAVNVVNDGFYSNHSLSIENHDNDYLGDARWSDGPVFDTGDNFEISGTVKPTGNGATNNIFIVNQTTEDRIGVYFDEDNGETYLSTHIDEASQTINNSFYGEWAEFRLQVDSGTAKLKVWAAGTSEPSEWQLEEDFTEFEGQFAGGAGTSGVDRTLYIDQIDAGGHVISGQFVDQNGEPVPNATVEGYGVDYAAVEERLEEQAEDFEGTAEELEEEAERLFDEAEGAGELPEEWQNFETAYGSDDLLDTDAWTNNVDGTYPLVHQEDDWGLGRKALWDDSVGQPRIQHDGDGPVVITLWAPSEEGRIENQIDGSYLGRTTSGEITIRELDPGGGFVDTTTYETSEHWETTNVYNDKQHHGVKAYLSDGLYQAYPAGQPGKAYTFQVGDAKSQWTAFETELENRAEELEDEADQYAQRAQGLTENIDIGEMERRTTTTDENGYFEIRFQTGIQRAAIQGYRADGTILTDITGPSFDDLRDEAENGYNGTFVLSPPQRHDVPKQDVTLEGYRADELPQHPLEDFNDFLEWKNEQILNETISELQSEYEENIEELEREWLVRDYQANRELVETVPGAEDEYLSLSEFEEIQDSADLTNDELETEKDLMQQALFNADPTAEDLVAIFESHATMIRSVPGAEEDYLESSQFDTIPDASELSESELETEIDLMQQALANIPTHAGDRLEQLYENHRSLVETVPGAEEAYLESSSFSEIQPVGDLSKDQLGREVELMATALSNAKEIEPPEITEEDILEIIEDSDELNIDPEDITEAESYLRVDYPLPDEIDAETITPEIHWSDGSSEEIPDEYWSVDDGGMFGDRTLSIEGFPLHAEDPASFDIRVQAASSGEDGVLGVGNEDGGFLDDRISATNPAFAGIVPDVRAVDVSTLSPGPSERVSLNLRTGDSDGLETLESVTVYGPSGSELAAEVTDSDSARFTTNGAGKHFVRATYTSGTGDQFVRTFSIRALEEGRNNYATVRAEGATGGEYYALAGDGLRDAEIAVEDDRVGISAIAPSGDTPARVDVKAAEVLGPQVANLDLRVLEGAGEHTIDSKVETVIHFDSLDEDAIMWRGEPSWVFGQPLERGEAERYGEVLEREDGKVVIRTYTEEDGSLSLYVNENPTTGQSIKYSIATSIPSISLWWLPAIVIPSLSSIVAGAAMGLLRRRHAFLFR